MASCSDPEMATLIAAYELGILPDERREAFEAHLLECEACFEELAEMEPVATRVRERKLAPEAKLDLASETGGAVRRLRRPWTLLLGAAMAATIAGILVWSSGPEPVLRGGEESPIVLYTPAGEISVPQRLDWKPVPGSVSYELSVRTAGGELVWSGTAKEPPVELPASVREALRPGQRFYWEMEAVAPDGARRRSDPSWFTVMR